jgi:hypothetical protein
MFQHVDGECWVAIAVETGGAFGNAGFVDLGGRALVIDACYTPAAARDLRAAAEEHVGRADRLFLTHVHFVHDGGSQVFTDLPIVSGSSLHRGHRARSLLRFADIDISHGWRSRVIKGHSGSACTSSSARLRRALAACKRWLPSAHAERRPARRFLRKGFDDDGPNVRTHIERRLLARQSARMQGGAAA